MSHEFETGFFVGAPAWHGLGNVLEHAPTIADGIVKAGLDWTVKQAPVQFERPMLGTVLPDGDAAFDAALEGFGETTEIGTCTEQLDSHFVNYRESDGAVLGVVGRDFTPLQNVEAFKWFEPLVESGEIQLEAAGSLRDGKRIWVLGSLRDGTAEVLPGDDVKSYLLLAHAHDGTLAIRAGFTHVRVVCQNTLSAAISGGDKLFKIRHTKSMLFSLEAAREVFDVQRAQIRLRADMFQAMARHTISDDAALNYWREVLHEGAGTNADIKVRNLPEIQEMFEAGRGAKFGRGTLWGAFNAITEYVTHGRGRTADSRVDSQWFGTGAQLLGRCLTVAEAVLKH